MEDSKIKKSIALSGLVSTAGLFAAKMIGLLYTIPFSYILSNDVYSAIYGAAYAIYSYILNVFTAGFPFAISTLVAKYSVKENYKTILEIRKLSLKFLAVLGAAGMLVMAALSPFLAKIMAVSYPEYTSVVRNVLLLLSLALLLVPILSALRGVVQGRKEMTEYAFSQTFEQIFRVGFLLSAALLVIYVLKAERVWALYGAVLSTSVAAAAAIGQVLHFEKKSLAPVVSQASRQRKRGVDGKLLVKEFLSISIPYLIVAILGYADDIYFSVLLPLGLSMSKYTPVQIAAMNSTMNFSGAKLKAIPFILAPGFISALIPHISAALTANNMKLVRKNVLECLNIVTFLAIPISFCIFLYAKPICHVLFYTGDFDVAVNVTRWIALEGLAGAVTPVMSNLLMALRERKYALQLLFFTTVIKGILMVPMAAWMGAGGAILINALSSFVLVLLGCRKLRIVYKVRLGSYYKKIILTLFCTAGFWAVSSALNLLGLNGMADGRFLAFAQMAANGLLSGMIFLGLALLFHLPQSIFHIRLERFLGEKI